MIRKTSWHFGIAIVATTLLSLICTGGHASAQSVPDVYPTGIPSDTVASDGAVTTNANWEAGKSSTWYIELQRIGVDYIEEGISTENPSQISQGIKILDWGWAQQGSDGSFPGTGSGSGKIGGMFHTTSLFFEAAARAVIDLQNYSPVTYDMPSNTYSAKIAAYKTDLALTGQWLTTPSVLSAGKSFDSAYTHRRYILAAGLQEAAVVTKTSAFSTIASQFISTGLSLQLGTGWTAAITQSADGTYPPATLLAPGASKPAGTVQVISAVGVNPERSGYDISYHMVGCLYACRWYACATDTGRKQSVSNMLIAALSWERTRMDVQGDVDPTGSTRIGVDETQDGEGIKTFSSAEATAAFVEGSQIEGKGRDLLGGIRIAELNAAPSSDTVTASGAVNSNSSYDTGKSSKFNVGYQADAATFIRVGIHREDESLIQEGLAILNWGWAQQASDGSFPGTSSVYNDPATFMEGAAQSVLLLQQYQPISHNLPAGGYSADITSNIRKIALTANYLQGSTVMQNYASWWSASRLMTYAAAMQEASVVTANSALTSYATTFLNDALAMQMVDGTDPENGVFSGNAQATSILESANYYAVCSSSSVRSKVATYIATSAARQMLIESVTGTISGSNPAIANTQRAFATAFQVTGDDRFNVEVNRINVVSL